MAEVEQIEKILTISDLQTWEGNKNSIHSKENKKTKKKLVIVTQGVGKGKMSIFIPSCQLFS